MRRTTMLRYVWGLVFAVVVSLPSTALAQEASPAMDLQPGVEVVANGLTNPRGFTWSADGTLYLALAGAGGDTQPEVEGTPIPYLIGPTSSVAAVADGCTSPVATGLGSALWTDAGWIWGAMDVAILGEDLYVLLGAGSDLGGNGIYRVLADGSIELVADLGAWMSENPPEFIAPDYDPTGSWFDLESDGEKLWVSEAVGGYLLTVSTTGEITVMADLSDGHMVPTGVALDGEGGAYVGFETTIPYPDGGSKVVHVAADGTVMDYWTGLTAVTDIVMGPDGVLYAAEMATGNTEEPPFLTPNSGRIVRMTGPDTLEEVVTDFEAPVYLAFGTDGLLYVTAPAYAPDAGEGHGALVQFDLGLELPLSAAGVATADPTCAGGATPETAVEDEATVTIQDFAFGPQTLEIAAGTTVIWTNTDSAPHTATADDGSFDTGAIEQGASASVTFDEPGTYTYICSFHPNMTGTIIVS